MKYWATEYFKQAEYYQQLPQEEPPPRRSSMLPLLATAGLGALGAYGLGHTEFGHNLGGYMDSQIGRASDSIGSAAHNIVANSNDFLKLHTQH